MKRMSLAVLLVAYTVLGFAGTPQPVTPESLRWIHPPGTPGFQFAWVLGAEGEPGPYVLRVKLAKGTAIAPHVHPDTRHTTVLEGTLYVAFAASRDDTLVVAVPAGAVYVTPSNTEHFVMAKDRDAVYQESGTGPTGTTLIKQ